jgi:hypothetical protein
MTPTSVGFSGLGGMGALGYHAVYGRLRKEGTHG